MRRYASGATQGYVYVRSEYPRARDALRGAVAEARDAGHLGADVHGSGFDFDVEVFEGAGSYVAGEETSLIHSMEGLRGEVARRGPRSRPSSGLFGRPTVVNNVETLRAVPWIVERGGEAYARLGAGGSKGTKLVCLNERFARPGVYEVELGVALRYICEELGGGLRDGHACARSRWAGRSAASSRPTSSTCRSRSTRCAPPAPTLGHGEPRRVRRARPGPRAAAPRVAVRRRRELRHLLAVPDRHAAAGSRCRAARLDGVDEAAATQPTLEELLETMGGGEPVRLRPERPGRGAEPDARLRRRARQAGSG